MSRFLFGFVISTFAYLLSCSLLVFVALAMCNRNSVINTNVPWHGTLLEDLLTGSIPEVNSYTTNSRSILEFHREDDNVLFFITQCNIGITSPLFSPMVVRSQTASWTVLQLERFVVTCNICTSECFKECCLLQIFPRRVFQIPSSCDWHVTCWFCIFFCYTAREIFCIFIKSLSLSLFKNMIIHLGFFCVESLIVSQTHAFKIIYFQLFIWGFNCLFEEFFSVFSFMKLASAAQLWTRP